MLLPNKLLLAGALSLAIAACNSNKQPHASETTDINEVRELEKEELVARGEYLLTIGGCHDCHTPKKFSPQGMSLDSSMLFAGHPANMPIPPIDGDALKPGNWMQMGPHITSFAGPWGMTFAANLTPDSATGIGAWTEEVFVKTLRTGKHLGQENGRPIMPPMPWQYVAKMTDEDLKAIYSYLRSLPPVVNRVPAPVPPTEVKTK
jgi:mono/diheme cytochrome c family protein